MKSPSGGKTDEDEPLAFRGGVSVFAVHVGGAGRGDQTDGPRPSQLRRLYIRLLFGGTVWNRLADVPGTQVATLGRTSGTRARTPLLLAFAAALLPAQSLELYSEFQRVDPFGNIVKSDRARSPREILSPAVARNGFASFHVVVSGPPRMRYFLYAVTNPANACRVVLYKEHFTRTKDGWVPDALSEIRRLPDFGAVPDPGQRIPEQTARLYLLDVWIPPDAEVGRFRLEVQLKVGYFIVRPLEIRVTAARVPDNSILASGGTVETASLPPVEQPADASTAAATAAYIAGKTEA